MYNSLILDMNRYKFIVSLFILQRLLSTHSMLGTKVGAGIRYSNCIQEVSRLSEIQFFSYVLCFICYRIMHRELLELKSFLLMSWNDWMNNKNKTDIISCFLNWALFTIHSENSLNCTYTIYALFCIVIFLQKVLKIYYIVMP